MAQSPLFGIDRAPRPAAGRDTPALGPGDSSDSGSDVAGLDELDTEDPGLLADTGLDEESARVAGGTESYARGADSDASGTGEQRSAAGDAGAPDGSDIGFDRIEGGPDCDPERDPEGDDPVGRELDDELEDALAEDETVDDDADEDTSPDSTRTPSR